MQRDGQGGLTKDSKQALAHYEKACNLGSSMGCKNYSELRGQAKSDEAAEPFRKALKTGDESHCGLVIEVKPPIAKVQTMVGEMWLKVEQLFPRGGESCKFHNGVYVDPRQ
jgi:TPR repeat protein